MNIDKLFDGMEKVEIFGSGTNMSAGQFEVVIKDIFVKSGFRGESFICEFVIAKTSNEAAHPVGCTRSYVMNFKNKYTFANITKLVMALTGNENTKENQDNPAIRTEVADITRAVCGSDEARKKLGQNYVDGMLNGIRVKLECETQPTQPKDGKPAGEYTVHKWSPIPE